MDVAEEVEEEVGVYVGVSAEIVALVGVPVKTYNRKLDLTAPIYLMTTL